MQLMAAFDATQFDPTQGVGQLPVGRHPVIIDSSEVKANNANDGGYLQLNLKIIDGPAQGTTGAYRLNLYHSNQKTVEIAHRQFSAVCHVVGVFKVADSSALHNIPFVVEVGMQKDGQYTEVKKVMDMQGNEPGKAPAPQGAAAPQGGGFGGGQQPQQGGFNGNQGQAPQGGFGGQQPQGQQPQGQQPQGNGSGATWGPAGGQQPQQPQQPQGAWNGGGQPAQGGQQQPAAAGWQQGGAQNGGGAPAGAAAPWGQR